MSIKIEQYFDRLWPLDRCIMGPDFRKSLDILEELIPMERLQFFSGQNVLDWTVPQEWVVNEAYFIGPDAQKYCDYKVNNLHLLGYSVPFIGELSLEQLAEHLHTLEKLPHAIPYVTSYYKKRWGFCIAYEELKKLPRGKYKVVIDTCMYDGCLQVGESVLKGDSSSEILFSTYLCHPSMANNELSGPLTLAFLYDKIKNMKTRRYTYRFVISAETIGTICYLSRRGNSLKKNLIAGYILTCLADKGNYTYKLSRDGNRLVDRMAMKVLRKYEPKIIPFNPGDGSDERQYCSPGFNLPVGSLMRTKYGEFKEYHTSLDNKEFISFEKLEESVNTYYEIVQAFEKEPLYKNIAPYGEPQLGRRGLYRSLSTNNYLEKDLEAIFWMLNLADGTHDLEWIAEKSGIDLVTITKVAEELRNVGLLTC